MKRILTGFEVVSRKRKMKSSKNTTLLLTRLPIECLLVVVEYLSLKEIFRLELCSQGIQEFVRKQQPVIFFQQYLMTNYLSDWNGLTINRVNEPRALARMIGSSFNEFVSENLLRKVVEFSSMDRPEESPNNVLEPSLCLPRISAAGKPSSDLTEFERLNAYYHQLFHCGCGRSSPCYWGSAPSRMDSANEFITFKLRSEISIIDRISVTPYRAFWHPDSPVYGARSVSLQLLVPSSELLSLADQPLPHSENRYRNLCGFRQDEVYYSTPFFPLQNRATTQEFILPKPILSVGGFVRLVFQGMHQRQTIEIDDVLHDDYFVCISHVTVGGFNLDHCRVENYQNRSLDISVQSDEIVSTQNNSTLFSVGQKFIKKFLS